MSDTEPGTGPPTVRAARWLRLLKLLLGVVVSALTVLRLLGLL